MTPRHLRLRAVVAKSYARIHWQNLTNFGVLPLEFDDPGDYDRIDMGGRLHLGNLHTALAPGAEPRLRLRNVTKDETYRVRHHLSDGRRRTVLAGGTIASLSAGGY
ncbi:hypothetical protein [Streptomyces sp. NPDC102462]|uniref:hypothetical protein n=1 Tax=Streptomyces sp. NPDC102462 TaxID=3366178 RepID=UPI0037FEC23E